MNNTYKDNCVVAKLKVQEILMTMNGLSQEGFHNRMRHDPYFRKGFDVFVQLFIQSKFNT